MVVRRLSIVLGAALMASTAARAVEPAFVVVVGSLQSEIGCGSDWNPACLTSALAFEATDSVWQGSFLLPSGNYLYGAAIDLDWSEAYGLHAQTLAGNEIPLAIGAARTVKFYYDDATHWVTDAVTTRIVTAPGSYQNEIGCMGDWQPDCLRAWLQDVDGDGIFRRNLVGVPVGQYEFKVAIDESWNENYGAGGVAGGASLAVAVAHADDVIMLRFVSATNTPSVSVVRDRLFRNGFE